jgi:predicted nucleotidyltransferase
MENTIHTIPQITATLAPLFAEYNVKKAVLFGSYAKGVADDKSDVDLCVDRGLRGLSEADILKIADTFTAFDDSKVEDVKGFCAIADLSEIAKQDFILTPNRWAVRWD